MSKLVLFRDLQNILQKPILAEAQAVQDKVNDKTQKKRKPLHVFLLGIFVFVPLLLFLVALPISFFFSLFYFTRPYTAKHTEFDISTIALVTDAIFCGLFFFTETVNFGKVSPFFENKILKSTEIISFAAILVI